MVLASSKPDITIRMPNPDKYIVDLDSLLRVSVVTSPPTLRRYF